MLRQLIPKLLVLVALPILGCFHKTFASEESPTAQINQTAPVSTPAKSLADGLYFVVRSAHEPNSVEPLVETERLVANDFHLLEPEEREPVVYLVLQTKPFVPLILGTNPTEGKEDGTGKPRLQLQLAENQIKPLEDFTRLHMGETVAIVIGGDVVTCHKVKSAITGGRLQVTRCTEHGCYTLYTKLLKSHAKK